MTDDTLLRLCRKQIETKLGRGDSAHWTTSDFGRLGEEVFEQTGISLSVNTLKRIWGRIDYRSVPNPTTLNALAGYLGYANWHTFGLAQAEPIPLPESFPDEAPPLTTPYRFKPSLVWSAGLLMGLSIALGLAFSLRSPTHINADEAARYRFSSRVVAEGLPNSVIFDYDATAARTDCVAIQQSWDPARRFAVDPTQHRVSSLYYYPGFFRAKLVVDGRVVQEHPLMIRTQGWLPLVEREPVPVYYKPEQARRNGMLSLDVAQLQASSINLQPTPPWVSYFQVGNWGRVSSENFTLETELKNDYHEGSAACQHTELVMLCEDNAIILPFSRPGCVSGLTLHAVDQHLEGATTDLSAFGCDFSQWVKVRCEVKNKHMRVFINNKPAYQLTFHSTAGALIGLRYRFEGTGSVNYIRLVDNTGKTIFSDDF